MRKPRPPATANKATSARVTTNTAKGTPKGAEDSRAIITITKATEAVVTGAAAATNSNPAVGAKKKGVKAEKYYKTNNFAKK